MLVYRQDKLIIRDSEETAGLLWQILQNGLAWNPFCLFGGDVVPYNSTILTDNEHGGCRLSIREEIVHAVFVGNSMFTVGQNRKLRLGFFNSACSLILWLNGQGNDLCSLFFIYGTVFFQPNELV